MRINKQSASERLRKAQEIKVDATLLSQEATTNERKKVLKTIVKDLETYARLKDDITIIVVSS